MIDTTVVQGRIDECLSFNGTSSMVSIPNDPSLDLINALTIEAWIKLRVWDTADRHMILSSWSNQVQFSIRPGIGLAVYLACEGGWEGRGYNHAASTELTEEKSVGKWVHVAVSWSKDDDGFIRLYINGKEAETYEYQQLWQDVLNPNTIPVTIGALPKNLNRRFNGEIDEVRIYDRRLTDAEIKTNFNAVSNTLAVQPVGKLTTVWGQVKN